MEKIYFPRIVSKIHSYEFELCMLQGHLQKYGLKYRFNIDKMAYTKKTKWSHAQHDQLWF